jgi:cell shape-determining protein MreC
MTQIIVTVITGLVAIATCTINSTYQASATRKITEYKLEELSKRVEKHNHLVERMYHLEEEHTLLKEKMSVANHRIDDLEHLR